MTKIEELRARLDNVEKALFAYIAITENLLLVEYKEKTTRLTEMFWLVTKTFGGLNGTDFTKVDGSKI